MTDRESGIALHHLVLDAAEDTDHVINRARLRELGVTRKQIAAQIAAGRWLREGTQTIAVRTGDLSHRAQCWRAVWELGSEVALVDGADALKLAGLKGWDEEVVHVSLLHRHTANRRSGVKVHKVIRRVEGEAARAGVPRTRPAIAAIRAAHWASTDTAAATILAMTVQQRLVTGPQLIEAQRTVKGRTRRAFLKRIVADIADGAQSLHELDFAAACRERGLPEPTRQAVKQGPQGRVYLDVYFEEYGLVVEIDGAGHLWALAGVSDALRANQLVIDGDRVLRINVVGLRVDLDAHMDQVAAALASDWAQANLARHAAAHAAA